MLRTKRRLKNLHVDRVDLVGAGANPGAHILVAKIESTDTLDGHKAEAPEALAKEVNEVPETPETVAKADFEALRKQLADEAELRKAEATKNAELGERIAKMELDRKRGVFVAKAAELTNLAKAEDLGDLLLEVSESVSAETFKALETLLTAANAQLAKGALFAQYGQAGAEPEGDKGFADKLTELAKAKVAAGTCKTIELAKLEVIHENAELRAEYRNGRN